MAIETSKHDVLKNIFGFNEFRDFQEEAIDTILGGQDLLMVLPTGGGKSLAYQLPSLMMDGVTIVISPLLALMQDQVASLRAQNIEADMLSSMQSQDESKNTIKKLYNKSLTFLYLSPERLNTDWMQDFLGKIKINFFVIDEAHCISQWGHEFRSDYRALSKLKNNYPNVPITAFTATAVSGVRDDIIKQLRLIDYKILSGDVFRKNLFIRAENRIKNGHDQLFSFLKSHEKENGIIYVSSRKKSESLSLALNSNGFNSRAYHAGLPNQERTDVYYDFVHDKINIVVATIAFGMGIDKSDIRYVVHMSLPKTIENYYQEIGRAGRDGESAEVLMLFGAIDIISQQRYINEISNEDYKKHSMEKLATISRYASSQTCRHKQISNYFENKMENCEKYCDNCTQTDVKIKDITKYSQMFLSTIYRVNQRFGKNYVIDILRGSKEQKILSNGHDGLSVYAIGEILSKKQWFVVFDRLLEVEAICIGEFQVLQLTNIGKNILKSNTTVDIRESRLDVKTTIVKVKEIVTDFNMDIFNELREIRTKLAREKNVPPYMIFPDKTLKIMSNILPKTKDKMLEINGVGEKKFVQYGKIFLEYFTK